MVEFGIQTDEEVSRVLTYHQPDRSLQSYAVTPPVNCNTPSIKAFSMDSCIRSPKQALQINSNRRPPVSLVLDFGTRKSPLRMPKPSARNVKTDGTFLGEISFMYRDSSPNATELLRLPKLQKRLVPTKILQKRTDHHYRNGRFSETLKPVKPKSSDV